MAFEPVSPGTTITNARLGHVAPPPSKRICIGTPNLVPPVPVSVAPAPPPPAESLSNDLNVGDSSSESSDSSVVLRPSTSSASLVAAAEGSGDKPNIQAAQGEATKEQAPE